MNLSVPFQRQEFVRDIEDEIRVLFSKLRRDFAVKDERELLSMMVYQYASYYGDLKSRYQEAQNLAEQCLRDMDKV